MDKTESVWTKKMGPREQWRIVRALFGFMQPFAKIFLFGATIGGNNFSVECGDAEIVTRFYEQSSSQYESTVANFGDVCAHLPGLDVS